MYSLIPFAWKWISLEYFQIGDFKSKVYRYALKFKMTYIRYVSKFKMDFVGFEI